MTAIETASPAAALQTVTGDETDALVKVKFDKTGTNAKATLTVAKAEVEDGVIKGAGIATGAQVADAIATEKARAEGVEGVLTSLKTTAKDNLVAAINENSDAIAALSAATTFQVVADHTAVTKPDTHTIYLEKPEGKTSYEEWIYVNKDTAETPSMVWEKLGDADIQLENYYDKTAIDTKVGTKGQGGDNIYGAIKTAQDAANSALEKIGDDTKGLTKALADEVTNRTNADADIQKQIGTGFSETKTIAGVIGSDETEGTILGRIKSIEDEIGEGGSVSTQIDNKIRAIAFTAGTQTNATAAINHVANSNDFTVDVAVADATGSAKGVVTLSDAINGTSAAADSVAATPAAVKAAVEAAATDASSKANARLGTITGSNGGGVSVTFSTTADNDKAVTTTVAVTESTLGTDTKFASDDKNVATGAKVQAAIDAAEARAKAAQTYTADETTITVASNKFSAKTGAVADGAATLTTGGQVHTAIESAKTILTGVTETTETVKTITKAIALAEAETTARKKDVNALLAGTKHAVGTVVECAVTGTGGTFNVTKP